MSAALDPRAMALQGLEDGPLLTALQGLLAVEDEAAAPGADAEAAAGSLGAFRTRRRVRRIWPLPAVELGGDIDDDEDLVALHLLMGRR